MATGVRESQTRIRSEGMGNGTAFLFDLDGTLVDRVDECVLARTTLLR
jgi:hypothetical protein